MSNPSMPAPPLKLSKLASVLSDRRRWKILNLLSSGEAMMVKEIAQRLGDAPANVSNHMKMLRSAGMVQVGSGRLYRLSEPYRQDPATRQIQFGFCTIHLDAVEKHGND